jgi:hypothetical protein
VRKTGEREFNAEKRELKHEGTERTEEHGEKVDAWEARIENMFSPSIFIIRKLSIDGVLTRGKPKANDW